MNRPRAKGTGGEREVKRFLEDGYGLIVDRMPPSSPFDLRVHGSTGRTIKVLATRPDRGLWLATITLGDLGHLLEVHGDRAEVEVKRRRAFPQHTLWSKEVVW